MDCQVCSSGKGLLVGTAGSFISFMGPFPISLYYCGKRTHKIGNEKTVCCTVSDITTSFCQCYEMEYMLFAFFKRKWLLLTPNTVIVFRVNNCKQTFYRVEKQKKVLQNSVAFKDEKPLLNLSGKVWQPSCETTDKAIA